MPLTLRPFAVADESEVRLAEAELVRDDFQFIVPGEDPPLAWAEQVELLAQRARGENLTPDRVRAVLLAAEVDRQLVGRTSIRFELTEWLEDFGGHIGYCVRPAHRRKGYATEILRQSLRILAADGTARALVTCDDDNIGSASVIERCGGVLEDRRTRPDGQLVRRYRVPAAACR